MHEYCPILVNFGAYTDDEGLWVVRLSDRTVRLRLADAQGQALWQCLGKWCDGQTPVTEVLSGYVQSPVGNVGIDAFKGLLDNLLEVGVLQDAAQVLPNLAHLARHDALWGCELPEQDWPTSPELEQHGKGVQWVDGFNSSIRSLPWHRLAEGRQSTYRFKDQGLTLSELGQLLQCYGAVDQGQSTLRRAVPSGGGLYQLKLWLLLFKPCEELVVGVYEVVYRRDGAVGFSRINSLPSDQVWQQALLASTNPAALQHASAWLMVGADLIAIAKKYRNLAYSHALVEAGALLQNLGLIASALNVGVHVRSGFDHSRLHAVCNAGDATLLISAVMGVKAASTDAMSTQRLRIEMGWKNGCDELPFHLAMSRVFFDHDTSMNCFGRSRDAELAYDKALSEAMERYAMMRGPEHVVARWGDLPNMIHPHLMLRQTDADFDEAQRCRWIAFENLANGKTHYVLQGLCFYHPSDKESHSSYCSVNTSGMACAPTHEMAMTLATLELVERDAFMRTWLTGASCQPLPLDMLNEDTRALFARFEAEGCRVVLGLLPSAWAVVVMAFVQHEQLGFTRISAAADFDAVSAAGKAMSEVANGVMGTLRGVQPESVHVTDVFLPEDHGNLYCQRDYFRQADFLVGLRAPEQEALPTVQSNDLLHRMWQAGLSVYACQVELPEEREYLKGGHPVVCRVVIPGLLAMVFGNAPFPLPEVVVPSWRVGESPVNRVLVHPFP